jgi:2-dehydropantoate 2-reductase
MREPRIVILGAGSVGCFIGGAWAASGLPVTFVGRPKIAADVGKHGVTLSDYSGWQAHLARDEVDYTCRPEVLANAQVIVVAVKSGDTAVAADEIAEHATPGALVISFQNGVSNIDVLERTLHGRFDVARGMVPYNVAYLGEGRFHKGVAGDVFVEGQQTLRRLAEAVESSGAPLHLSDDMLALAWGKLLINLNNAVNALSGKTLQDQLKNRDYRRVFAASMREGLELLDCAQIKPAAVGPISPTMLPRILDTPDWLFNSLFIKRWKIDSKARSSMADDLAAGRQTEVDHLNGELVRLADHLQRTAPINRAIVDLMHNVEAAAKPMGPVELRKAVLGR